MSSLTKPKPYIDLERRQLLIECHNVAPICHTFGMTLHYNEQDEAIIELPHNPKIDQGFGVISGGVIATLIDHAGWFVVAQYVPYLPNTVEMHVRFLERFERENIKAIGRIIKFGKSLFVFEVDVFTHTGKKVVIGTGTYMVISVPITSKELAAATEKFGVKDK